MRQYETFELKFTGNPPNGSWSMVDLWGEFYCDGHPSRDSAAKGEGAGLTKKVQGFYAGSNTYIIRFLPEYTGMVQWKVTGLFQESGEEECVAGEGGGCHGLVRPDGTALAYEDGSACRLFGTTVYAMMHQPEELIAQTIETLKESPFNKLRTCVFPKHYIFNENDPTYFAFEKKPEGGFDFHRPCFPFWDAFETAIRELEKSEIQIDLILFHPYDCWGFSKMTREEYVPYLTYLLARFAAYSNLWWSLANEYDCMDAFKKEDWDFIDSFINEHDPYHHMMSCHHMLEMYDFSRPQITHVSVQGDVMAVEELMNQYHKPVCMDEFGYEGNIGCHWGHLSGFEEVHRFWLCTVMGGIATHGETFMDANDVLWWGKGGILKGQSPARIAFLRSIIEELPGALSPVAQQFFSVEQALEIKAHMEDYQKELELGGDFLRALMQRSPAEIEQIIRNIGRDTRIFTGHCGEEAYLAYYGRHCTAVGTMELPENGSYRIEVIDVWEMTRETILTGVNGQVDLELPGKEGIAVLAVKE